jgi:hypothetical protein
MRRGILALLKHSLIQFLLTETALSRPAAALTINLTYDTNEVAGNVPGTAADGQTLVIDTTGRPDLDGLGTAVEIAGHLVEAVQGNLHMVKAPGDAVGATVVIRPGRTATVPERLDARYNRRTANVRRHARRGTSLLRGSLAVEYVNQLAAPAASAGSSPSSPPPDCCPTTSCCRLSPPVVCM